MYTAPRMFQCRHITEMAPYRGKDIPIIRSIISYVLLKRELLLVFAIAVLVLVYNLQATSRSVSTGENESSKEDNSQVNNIFWPSNTSTKQNNPIAVNNEIPVNVPHLPVIEVKTESVAEPIPAYLQYSEEVKERIRENLQRGDQSTYDVQPFVKHKSIYKIAPDYNLAACQIEKSMSTLVASIMCYLFDTDNFVKANRTITTESYWTRYCAHRNEIMYTRDLLKLLPKNRTTIFVVRDPTERFISGYVNKCITELKSDPKVCYDCNGDLGCAISGLHEELRGFSNGSLTSPTYISRHFAPHSWSCDLQRQFENYTFVKYGNGGEAKVRMANTFADIFKASGIEQYKIDETINAILGNNIHGTRGLDHVSITKKKIEENPEYKRLLVEMFGSDYDLFGFPRP